MKTSPLIGGDSEVLKDEFNFEQDTDALKRSLFADNDDEDDVGDGASNPDGAQASSFLNVYKEDKDEPAADKADGAAGIKDGVVRTRADAEEGALDLPNEEAGASKPAIQELSSTTFDGSERPGRKQEEEKPKEPEFNWETAEQVDAKFQFINQGELIFLNFNFKGYKRASDVRYAISENEVILEVRDVAKNKVHRLCKTLFQQIDVESSDVQLLVDYIIFKFKKKESAEKWDDVGYDIQNFSVPDHTTGIIKSNHWKQKLPEKVVEEANKENSSTAANQASTEVQQQAEQPADDPTDESKMTEEEKAAYHAQQEEDLIQLILNRAKVAKASAFLHLTSDVFGIY